MRGAVAGFNRAANDHDGKLDPGIHVVGLRIPVGEPRQDFPAPPGLADQQVNILRMRTFRRQLPFQLLGHQGDGGQRRSQFMGRRGGKSVKC